MKRYPETGGTYVRQENGSLSRASGAHAEPAAAPQPAPPATEPPAPTLPPETVPARTEAPAETGHQE